MVVATHYTKGVVGRIYRDQTIEHHGQRHIVTFQILRVATRQDYEEYCASVGDTVRPETPGMKYYQISVD